MLVKKTELILFHHAAISRRKGKEYTVGGFPSSGIAFPFQTVSYQGEDIFQNPPSVLFFLFL